MGTKSKWWREESSCEFLCCSFILTSFSDLLGLLSSVPGVVYGPTLQGKCAHDRDHHPRWSTSSLFPGRGKSNVWDEPKTGQLVSDTPLYKLEKKATTPQDTLVPLVKKFSKYIALIWAKPFTTIFCMRNTQVYDVSIRNTFPQDYSGYSCHYRVRESITTRTLTRLCFEICQT